jgi:hypothetical protein
LCGHCSGDQQGPDDQCRYQPGTHRISVHRVPIQTNDRPRIRRAGTKPSVV